MGEIEKILSLKNDWERQVEEEKRKRIYDDIQGLVQKKWEKMIKRGLIQGAAKLIKVTGINPDFEDAGSVNVVQSAYAELLEEKNQMKSKSVEKMKKLCDMTGIAPKFGEKDVHEVYEKLVACEMISYVDILRGITGVKPHEELIQRMKELRAKREKLLKESLY
jgi:hypothetical protein